MTPSALLALYDDTMRRNAEVAGCARELTSHTSRYSTASGSLRYVMWHQFSATEMDRRITDEIVDATGQVKALMWKVYDHDTPGNLGERLCAQGFVAHDPCALMAAPVARVIASLGAPSAAIEVRQLREAHEFDAYQEIWDSVWPQAPNARYVNDYRQLAADDNTGVIFFAGFADRGDSVKAEPVTSGYLFHALQSPYALLCGGATKANWRKQHAYTAMLAARASAARYRGATYLAVEASPESQPILARLGFELLSTLLFYEMTLG